MNGVVGHHLDTDGRSGAAMATVMHGGVSDSDGEPQNDCLRFQHNNNSCVCIYHK